MINCVNAPQLAYLSRSVRALMTIMIMLTNAVHLFTSRRLLIPVLLLAGLWGHQVLASEKVFDEAEIEDVIESTTGTPPQKDKSSPSISALDFQNVLLTEVHQELEALRVIEEVESQEDRNLRSVNRNNDDSSLLELEQQFWDQTIRHGWFMSERLTTSSNTDNESQEDRHQSRKLSLKSPEDQETKRFFPFLICDRSSKVMMTGNQRLERLLRHTDHVNREDIFTIFNDEDQTCFYISSVTEKAQLLQDISEDDADYAVVPMTDLMKISRSTISEVSKGYWPVPSPVQEDKENEDSEADDWERTVRIMLAPSERKASDEKIMSTASHIIEDIKSMGQEGSRRRRRRLLRKQKGSMNEEALSVTEAFSLTSTVSKTATSVKSPYSRRAEVLALNRAQVWSRALEEGIEAYHTCSTMFERLDVRPHHKNEGFDLVLNPRNDLTNDRAKTREDVESSASNMNCIISLIIAASVHPNVMNVEVDTPITPDDFESQWITQSNSTGYRPFFHAGLKGAGQIISVVDSGLNMEHPSFGPAAETVKKNWDLSSRKVVKYDYSLFKGDFNEEVGGHGSKVAAIIAGSLESGEEDEKDGIAVDAQLHVFDIQVGSKAYTSPGARKIFRSTRMDDDGGANIINTSWSSTYKPYYTGTCRNFDEALYDTSDAVLVASVGNSAGRSDGVGTVGDPASCKNSLAVGASQSTGSRIGNGDHGHGHMANFSSRGPTADKRIKPDIVAPGYSILTVSVPNEEKEVMGTSYSAPVVAGNAAIVRQYFEEGWYPKGAKNSGASLEPSGSLVKAVLVNGAHALHGIQSVPEGHLDQIHEYDNNQGAGALTLMSTLFVKGTNAFRTVIRNDKEINDRQRHNHYIQARSDNELSVTLVWYDPPSEANCAHCLLNNLDVWVSEVNNRGRVSGPRHYANGLTHSDSRNTVERIRIHMKAGRRYRITVSATNLSEESARYSFVMTGKYKTQNRVVS